MRALSVVLKENGWFFVAYSYTQKQSPNDFNIAYANNDEARMALAATLGRIMIKDLKRYPEMANPQLRPRYSGVATFFRTPLRDDAEGIDIGVVGIPFDGGVTNRTGARHGPRAVREQTTLVRR